MNRYSLDDLILLMARLRDAAYGCPWDLQQDFASIAPYTVEEAHEVADAIARRDMPGLRGELGDLLFQVLFHARMAEEQGLFDLGDVIDGLVSKMLRRHPHVFPDGRVDGERRRHDAHDIAAIKTHWEATKKTEKQAAGEHIDSVLDGVLLGQPALARAQKLQKKAARVGFDWPDISGVTEKLHEEVAELEQALASGDAVHVGEEIGDMLFTLVNLARKQGLDAEALARAANLKFETRFRKVEAILAMRGVPLDGAGLATLDAAWDEAKQQLQAAPSQAKQMKPEGGT